jgi:hypothetical protein
MIRKMRRVVIVALAAPAILAAGQVAVAASNRTDRPAWVNQRGVVEIDQMPAEVPVVDHAGRLVTDAHGQLMLHHTAVGHPPPEARP